MARGRHYAKLSLSNAARLSFSDLCSLLFLFLSLCRLCVCVFLCSHWSLVDVPPIFFCPADHVPDWQPRVLLGMVEARSVNVKKTTTTQHRRRLVTRFARKNTYCNMQLSTQLERQIIGYLEVPRSQKRNRYIIPWYIYMVYISTYYYPLRENKKEEERKRNEKKRTDRRTKENK